MTVGRAGSIGLCEAMPPRRLITSSGGASWSIQSDRSRLATHSITCRPGASRRVDSGSRSACAIDLACSAVESTRIRRWTTHQMRVGAVRRLGVRSAWDASHQMAMSRQAVLPTPVGTPISAGH